MTNDPPKRTESTELTIVRPRDSLPPRSSVPGPTIDQLAAIARSRLEAEDGRITLQPCPLCHDGLITPTKREAFLERYPELADDQPPPSQPDPGSAPPPRAA